MQFDSFYAPNYTLLRTLSSQVAEATPVAGTFTVSLSNSPYTDIVIVGSAVGGTVTPDSVIFETFGLYTITNGTQVVVKLDAITIDAVNIATPIVRNIRSGCDKVWVTARFIGGSAPTVSAVIYARSSWGNLLSKSDFTYDIDGNLQTRDLSYDAATGSNKVFGIYDVSDKYSSETPVDISGTSLSSSNFDISMGGYRGIGIQVVGTSGTAGSVKFKIQTTKDPNPATTNFATITSSVGDLVTNAKLVPDGSGDITIPITATTYDLSMENIGALVVRVGVTVSSHANNVLKIFVYKYY